MKYEVGTQGFSRYFECLRCAIQLADSLMLEGNKTYIRDTIENKIIYGNYFKIEV